MYCKVDYIDYLYIMLKGKVSYVERERKYLNATNSIFTYGLHQPVDVRLLRLWANITITDPETGRFTIERRVRDVASYTEVELSPSNIQPRNEIWILTIDRRGYSTTFENGVWMKELFELFINVKPDSGILLGRLEVEPAGLQQAKTRLYAALNRVSTQEIDVLYIYDLLARIVTQARAVGFTFGNKDPETMKKRYLPYMKAMMEGKGSGSLGLITGEDEEIKYRQVLARLFRG
ncbi:hypothetical protein F5876DRAFT_70027 [Lentinula aff. lateritia]|uniref:Uncharacterized protein n=1 Tax=Lentinula aff. lateritia TaxID=2804960 RepID=A0ACC1TKB7_9AGAR|nr:hypothetical protein F5876DRAFT_70027 [Lentinula aff. lateritia]